MNKKAEISIEKVVALIIALFALILIYFAFKSNLEEVLKSFFDFAKAIFK